MKIYRRRKFWITLLIFALSSVISVGPVSADTDAANCTPGDLLRSSRGWSLRVFACWSLDDGTTVAALHLDQFTALMKSQDKFISISQYFDPPVGSKGPWSIPEDTEFYASCIYPFPDKKPEYWLRGSHCDWLAIRFYHEETGKTVDGFIRNDPTRYKFELISTGHKIPVVENGCIHGRTRTYSEHLSEGWRTVSELCHYGNWILDENGRQASGAWDRNTTCIPGETKFQTATYGSDVYTETCWTLPNGEHVVKPDIVGYFANLKVVTPHFWRWSALTSLDGQSRWHSNVGDEIQGTCMAHAFPDGKHQVCKLYAVRYFHPNGTVYTGQISLTEPFDAIQFVSQNLKPEDWLPLPAEGCPEGRTRFGDSELCSSGIWIEN